MASFDSGGVEISYDVEGDGEPVLLIHGFASSREGNWKQSGWYDALTSAGRQVIAFDCRAFGESGKPHDTASYEGSAIADDAIRLLDHLGLDRVDLMGYSMGAGISAQLLTTHEDRFRSVTLAGIGGGMLQGGVRRAGMGDAMRAKDPSKIENEVARNFRAFAEANGNDLLALAAYSDAEKASIDPSKLGDVTIPVLVVTGEKDDLVGDPTPLAEAIPGAKCVIPPGTDHLTTVGSQAYKDAVIEFLDEVSKAAE